jgi:hypothetical protein
MNKSFYRVITVRSQYRYCMLQIFATSINDAPDLIATGVTDTGKTKTTDLPTSYIAHLEKNCIYKC